jgi:hypothetical protein
MSDATLLEEIERYVAAQRKYPAIASVTRRASEMRPVAVRGRF